MRDCSHFGLYGADSFARNDFRGDLIIPEKLPYYCQQVCESTVR